MSEHIKQKIKPRATISIEKKHNQKLLKMNFQITSHTRTQNRYMEGIPKQTIGSRTKHTQMKNIH